MAYAFEDNGSLQNTASAIFFGSRVSPIRPESSRRPTSSRLGMLISEVMPPANPSAGAPERVLDAFLTRPRRTLTRP